MSDNKFSLVIDCSLQFLKTNSKNVYDFWQGNCLLETKDLVSACDVIYSLCLLNHPVKIQNVAIENFFTVINNIRLYGEKLSIEEKYDCNAHASAYIFGTIQLLRKEYPEETKHLTLNKTWEFNAVLDTNNIPTFPPKFTHHSWRVSHWLGGVPSIILNLYRETGEEQYKQLFDKVINSLETKAITKKGLIKVHKSSLVHIVFRFLYKIRHDPKIGDIGGIVHILWLYHFTNRPYKSLNSILNYALELTQKQEKFMETVPYCLDFDFIQLIRTALEQQNNPRDEAQLFEKFKGNLISYLTEDMLKDERFTLHKLPGALATLHECELYLEKRNNTSSKRYADIIKIAGWL